MQVADFFLPLSDRAFKMSFIFAKFGKVFQFDVQVVMLVLQLVHFCSVKF